MLKNKTGFESREQRYVQPNYSVTDVWKGLKVLSRVRRGSFVRVATSEY